MKSLCRLAVILTVASAIATSSEPAPPVVSVAWLQEHLSDDDLVVLHVAFNRRDFQQEHIPGARFVWWSWVVPSTPDYSSELPPAAELDSLLEGLGVSNSSRIVLYFTRSSVTSGTRVLYTLQYYGLGDRASMLDGGLEAWKAAGGRTTTEIPDIKRGSVTLRPQPALLASADDVRAAIDRKDVAIVDARTSGYYNGTSGSTRQGHIRSAVSIPYSSLTDSLNVFKPLSELRAMFRDAGVPDGASVISYCHVGQQATVVFQAARMLGLRAAMYDGSYDDWSYLDDAYPVDNPAAQRKQ